MKYPLEPKKDRHKISELKCSDGKKPEETDKGVMKQIKKVVKKFREKEKH